MSTDERERLLKQCDALSWAGGAGVVRMAQAALPAPIHGVFFVTGEGRIAFAHLEGCAVGDASLPLPAMTRILHVIGPETDVVLDIQSAQGEQKPSAAPCPMIRFYAAAPVRLAGVTLGGVFAMDRAPRRGCSVTMKMALLNLADAVSKELRWARLNRCSPAMNPQLSLTGIVSPIQGPLAELKSIATSAEGMMNFADGDHGDRMQHLQELKLSAESMSLLLGQNPTAMDTSSIPTFEHAAALLTYVAEVTPMLVSDQRVVWTVDPVLSSTRIHAVESTYTILLGLILPLSMISKGLRIDVKYSTLRYSGESIETGLHNSFSTTDISAEYGQMEVEIQSHNPALFGGPQTNSLTPLEVKVQAALLDLKQNCVSPLKKQHDLETDTLKFGFSVLCSKKSDVKPLSFCRMKSLSDAEQFSNSQNTLELPRTRLKLVVLVVDDTPVIVKMLTRMLAKLGCTVESAHNGDVAVRMVEARFEYMMTYPDEMVEMYDMIFMDFMMPVMDGLSAMRALQSWRQLAPERGAAWSNTLLFGLSATANEQEQNEGFAYGMHYFIPKPINAGLLSKIYEWKLERLRSEDIVMNIREFVP